MAIFNFHVPAGQVATFTATTAATVTRLADSPGASTEYSPVSVSAAGSLAIGPHAESRRYQYDSDNAGSVAYSLADFDTAAAQAALDVRVTAAEAAILANATPATNAGTKAAVSTLTATETGDAYNKVTTLTLTNFAVGTAADDASLAIGALLYTLPTGTCSIDRAHVSVGLTLDSDTQTDTPELGLGTVVGSGANATLGDVGATSENIMAGAAVADVEGTAYVNGTPPSSPVLVETAGAHTIYLNVADTWVDTTTGTRALTATGTIRIFWKFLGA